MSGNADLVEAMAFARRRLVTAFVAGRVDCEPPRAGRSVVAGVVAAGLLLAGAAITAVVAPRAAVDWQGPGLVVDEDTGALYLVADGPVLRPVVNATSARLLAGGVAPQSVPGDEIARSPQGPPAGLPTAPAVVPEPDHLLTSGWTACTGTGRGLRVALAAEPAVQPVVPGTGLVVDTGARRWLLATSRSYDGQVVARRHPVRPASAGVPATVAEVDPAWARLFPQGEPAAEVEVSVPAPAPGEQVCALLDHDVGGRPAVRLGVAPRGAAVAQSTAVGARSAHLEAGHAALVRGADRAGRGDRTAYLVAGRGERHRVTDDALARLGLGAVEPTVVPERWLALLPSGVALSVEAARCGPGERADGCDGSG